jgi:polygalacturonase
MKRALRPLLAATAVAALLAGTAEARICRPEDYGAVHDGRTLDTAAIQKAIDDCGAGDKIVLAAGVYLSGPLTLSSGDTFVVAKGAMLLGTPDHSAYRDGAGRTVVPLIGARNVSDITLSGEGIIDGNGASWWSEFRAAKAEGREDSYLRPKMIVFDGIENLRVTGLTLQNSPMFHLVPSRAHNVVVDGITITAPADSPNTDGIDPSGRDMLFQNLTIDVGDDNIAIKSDRADPVHPGAASANMVIRNCHFLHGHGMSIGSGTSGGVQNILAENIRFEFTKIALRIKSARDRGGIVRGVVFRNITMDRVQQAILITAYYQHLPASGSDSAMPIGPRTPDFYDITFEHITATGTDIAGGLYGLPERPLHDIRLIDVHLAARRGFTVRHATASISGGITADEGAAEILQENGTLTHQP